MSLNQASTSTSEDWGRSRMQIPSLVYGVPTTKMNIQYVQCKQPWYISGADGAYVSSGNDGGREEEGSSDGFPSPTETNPPQPAGTSSENPLPGTRLFCTYVHPTTGKQCTNWVKGFSLQSVLLRHQMHIHGQEEMRLLKGSQLTLKQSVINSRERLEYLERHYALTRFCEECGTEFTSGRHDALARHINKGACERKLEARAKLIDCP